MLECAFSCNAAANINNADLMLFRTPIDGSEPCERLMFDHDVLLSHEPPQRLPSLYWRSQARLPTGHPLWPARRGTCPIQVLEAQEISGNSQRVGPPGQSMMRTGQAACQRYREVSCLANDATRSWSAAGR